MNRLCSVLLGLVVAAAPARAHFVWILPGEPNKTKPTARLIFSDSLEPDRPELLEKVRHTELFARGTDGKVVAVKLGEGQEALPVLLPAEEHLTVAGVCRYGVVQRGKAEPFLLHYYPKTFTGLSATGHVPGLVFRAWDKLPLEIVPVRDITAGRFVRVLWQGKPLAGAEVVLLAPGKDKGVEAKTDREGLVRLAGAGEPGLYGIRARHTEDRAGEHDGKKYTSVRHYATLTFPVTAFKEDARKEEARPEADPAATKLLADARAARATWRDFPGFTADLEVNLDGKVARGRVDVSGEGKVAVKLEDEAAAAWAKRQLASVVGHRLDGGAGPATPCAFADDTADHPLGRAIRVLNDEFHSSYRIRDRQVIVVNRGMPARGVRFTITVMANHVNEEGQYLPSCYVVNTWDDKAGALKSSDTFHQTWKRVGKYDLPAGETVVSASAGKLEARALKLTGHQLKPAAQR